LTTLLIRQSKNIMVEKCRLVLPDQAASGPELDPYAGWGKKDWPPAYEIFKTIQKAW